MELKVFIEVGKYKIQAICAKISTIIFVDYRHIGMT